MYKKILRIFYFALIIILPMAPVTYNTFFRKTVEISIPDFQLTKISEKKISSAHCYVFSDLQKSAMKSFFEKNGDAALLIQLRSSEKRNHSTDSDSISFGFLSADDIPLKRTFSERISSHPVVGDSFNDHEGKSFALAVCFDKDKSVPAGFFVRTKSKFIIESLQIIRGCIGYNFSGDIPVFAFGPNGGANNMNQIDFSGASMVFSPVNSKNGLMPVYTVRFSENEGRKQLAFGGEVLNISCSEDSVEIPAASLKFPFSALTFPDGQGAPEAVMLTANENANRFSADSNNVLSPIKCDPGLVMNWSRNNWRGSDYELFEWDRFPGILFFDISTYDVQDDFFRRLAFFVEKAGYKGRLLSDSELEGKHGYNAHDYRAESLAEFFEKARYENFPLNSRELLLKKILLENGIILIESDGSVKAGRGAVISISQESPYYLRTTFIAHEGWHGIFFVDEEFRNTVASIYYTMDQKSLAYLRRYFQITPSLNYDVRDDYLMKNEFMAYMLQRPLSVVCKYYIDMASRSHSQTYAKDEADYIISTGAAGLESAATLLNQYVNDRWGLAAGRVWRISR